MKITAVTPIVALLLCLIRSSNAFSPLPLAARSLRLYVTAAPSDVKEVTLSLAKAKLLEVAKKIHAENGFQVFAKAPKAELKKAVQDLETVGRSMPKNNDLFLGDWTLLVTTASNREGIDTARIEESLPAFLSDPIKKIRSDILDVTNKYLVVQQKIKDTNNDGIVDRIDHTLELEPPKQLRDVLDNLPEQLSNVNINPLSVTKSKLVLIHNASMVVDENDETVFKTKINLQSIVLNVAGTSKVLDPNGKDVAGINIPSLGDFINTGDFETTYMDEDIRISRGKIGPIEQLRVFVRTEPPTTKYDKAADMEEEEIVDIEAAIADVDVGSITDPHVQAPSDVENDDELNP